MAHSAPKFHVLYTPLLYRDAEHVAVMQTCKTFDDAEGFLTDQLGRSPGAGCRCATGFAFGSWLVAAADCIHAPDIFIAWTGESKSLEQLTATEVSAQICAGLTLKTVEIVTISAEERRIKIRVPNDASLLTLLSAVSYECPAARAFGDAHVQYEVQATAAEIKDMGVDGFAVTTPKNAPKNSHYFTIVSSNLSRGQLRGHICSTLT